MIEDIYSEKLINAILYYAKNVKYPTFTKIFKLLYFLDFEHFKQTGRPVTNQRYYAWKFGPVPKNMWFDIQSSAFENEFQDYIRIIPFDNEYGRQGSEIKPKRKPILDIFTPREKKIMDDFIYIYKETKPTEVSEISHLKNQPWDITIKKEGEGSEIDYMLAIDDEASISEEEATVRLQEHEEFLENYYTTNIHEKKL